MTESNKQSNNEVTEWLEMRYIGQHANYCVLPPDKRTTFVYTPTGRICAYIRDFSGIEMGDYFSRRSSRYHVFDYIFTFVDLENKVCYDIKFENKTKVDNFYFISEDVLVIVAAYNTLVKQSVYKVDYINQKFELKETIDHSFMKRPLIFTTEREIVEQQNKFIRLDGIDYVILIGPSEISEMNGPEADWHLLRIYLIPKDPAEKAVPPKEFQVHFRDEDQNIHTTLREFVDPNGERFDTFHTYPDESTCFVYGSKVYLSYLTDGIKFIVPGIGPCDTLGTLIGAYWTIDITKLKDIKNRNVEFMQLIPDQVDAYEFVNTGELHFAEKVYIREMDNNMGLICLFRKNKDSTIGHLYKWNINDGTKPKVIEYPILCDTRLSEWAYRFTLYTNGTPLIFAFNKNNLSVYFKVAKCLKTNLNLQSLAFNRAFFHKNTPIRYHPAYRLCYGRMQPLKYKEQFSDEIMENMED